MDAAIRTYGEKGFRNTSVKAVCVAAGLTERYFYEWFENSEDLLQQCFTLAAGELTAGMRDAAQNTRGGRRERVRAALLTHLGHLKGTPLAARLFLMDITSVSQETDALVSRTLDEFAALLLDVIGRRPPHDDLSPLLLKGVVGGGRHVARAWVLNGYAETADEVADTLLRLYLLVQ